MKKGKKSWEKQQKALDAIVNDFHILPITEEILRLAGFKEGALMANGITMDIEDVIIGITAEQEKAQKILTKNPKHFAYFKVVCESP